MKSLVSTIVVSSVFGVFASGVMAHDENKAELWSCRGYCFMGGDTPTNPWIPVSSTGASEEEARDNIDCGPFVEVEISCRKVEYIR